MTCVPRCLDSILDVIGAKLMLASHPGPMGAITIAHICAMNHVTVINTAQGAPDHPGMAITAMGFELGALAKIFRSFVTSKLSKIQRKVF